MEIYLNIIFIYCIAVPEHIDNTAGDVTRRFCEYLISTIHSLNIRLNWTHLTIFLLVFRW